MLSKIKSKNKHKNAFKKVFKSFDARDKFISIVAILFVAISSAADIVNPFFMGKVMEKMNTLSGSTTIPWDYFGIMIGLAFISILFQLLVVWCCVTVAAKNSAKLRDLMFSNTRYLSSQDVNRIGSGSILTRITSDMTQLEQFLLNYTTMVFKGIFFIIGGFIMSLYQLSTYEGGSEIWFATIAYLFVISFVFIAGILVKKAMPYFEKGRVAIDQNNIQMQENIVGHNLIRSLNLENDQLEKYKKGNKTLFETLLKSERIIAILMPLTFFLVNTGVLVIYVVAGTNAWIADLSKIAQTANLIAIIVSFTQYLMIITLGLVFFATFGYVITRAQVSAGRIFEIIEAKSSIKEKKKPKVIKNGSIEFKNVFFKYEDNNNVKSKKESSNTLSNISFKIPAGKSLGIIGQTGSGKSSIIRLLTRLYDIKKGEIKIGGINLKDISFESLRKEISVSLQEKVILKGTYRSNILIGKTDATEKEIIEAAKNAEAWEYISLKEGQLDGIVEERGSNLSGGQKQRLSIARALIKKSKILIIDDSTSALDTITEKKILSNLDKNFKGVTKIIISQKVKSIEDCDNIIVLDEGKIIQQGTHKELMKDKNGIYKKISDSQKTSLEG